MVVKYSVNFHFWKKEIGRLSHISNDILKTLALILHFYNFGKSETIGSGKRFQKRDVYSSVLDSCLSRNLHRKPGSELIHSFVNRWS